MTLSFLIGLVVLILVLYLIFYLLGKASVPEPVRTIVLVLFTLIVLLYLLKGTDLLVF